MISIPSAVLVAWSCAFGGSDAGGASTASGGALELERGDRICLIGNALAERMQHDGWFETLLHERCPELELTIRNLGFAADELAVRQRTDGFGSQDEWLARCRADVVVAFFGYVESFRGESGLADFRRDLDAFVVHTLAQKYDGARAPRIVLASSIAHEDHRDPLLPDGREHNARLVAYHRVMADVARERGVAFVDLFAPMQKVCAARNPGEPPLTVDGIHLNERGGRVLGEILVDALCGKARPAASAVREARLQFLRAAVLEKDRLWFNRHQPTDGYNVHGGRSALAYMDGLSNFDVLQRELEILEVMASNRDRRIWALAQGRDVAIDDSNLPPKILVRTNYPGPLPDGAHEFLEAEAAIERMTTPAGLRVELFADERRFPELAKPVQMSFDARGRLWVAAWPTYPHWEPGRPMNDKLLIFEDHDGDGRADACKTFAGDLHNPTGFEFWNGGVLVAQAPYLMFLKDTDGDDVADVRERLLSNLSSADTHHTANSFVFGPDGGLYFQEGTFHQTQIESIHGPERNHNACVWRFEPRTFRVERHVAYDFANPHGHVFDDWGQEFVSDGTGSDHYFAAPLSGRVVHPAKHSRYFPFFAQRTRPCPATAILSSRHFPPELEGSYLVANVIGMLGILQYRMQDDGSGFTATEAEPLVQSSDPSFRPSDLEVGPDGALWFVDWYNPIIGHMQHHLRDPNRDHAHGRVYRIRCSDRPLLEPKSLAGLAIPRLLDALKEPEERVRYRARLELSARDSKEVVVAAKVWVRLLEKSDPALEHHRLEALWLQQQHGELDELLLDELLHSDDPRARAAAVRVLRFGRRQAEEPLAKLHVAANDPHPRVRLDAVVTASFFDDPRAVQVVLDALKQPTDRFLDYAIGETMRTLDATWRAALVAGELDLAGNEPAVRWLVARASDAELDHLPRIEPVLAAILQGHGTTVERRRAAAAELAALHGTFAAEEVVGAMRAVDEGGGPHARHVQEFLGKLLLELLRERAPQRAALVELADGARLPETGAFARAAIFVLDGGIEPSFAEAAGRASVLQACLAALAHIDPATAATARERVRAVLFAGGNADGDGGAGLAPREPGWFLSYYPVRLRTASREGFAALQPAATRVLADATVHLPGIEASDAFALRLEATLHVETAGEHRFHLVSDDGSRLYVDGELVVDNDLDHVATEVTGARVLAAGAHELELTYFDQGGHEDLALWWSGPGFERQPLPRERLTPRGADPVRLAAVRALAALPGDAAEKAADAARLLDDEPAGGLSSAALELLATIEDQPWGEATATHVLDAIEQFARRVPAEQRTRGDVMTALELGERLATRLPDAAASARRETLRAMRGSTHLIKTVPHQMLYDRTRIVVEAGKPVAIVFQNNDLMPHNLVVTAPGTLEEVGTAAEAMALEPGAQAKSYVPELPSVLHALRLLLPGESATLRFVAPSEPGDYPFVCTFPGHWRVMNGIVRVVEKLDAAVVAEAAAADVAAESPAVSARPFVKLWTIADLEPALASGWDRMRDLNRGRRVFTKAGCVQCHHFRGEGVATALDLGDVRERFRDLELARQIVEPSAVIKEGWEQSFILRKDGSDLLGRIVKDEPDAWHVNVDLRKPDVIELVKKSDVDVLKKSKLSPMPTGLLVTFTRDEILDLLALLQSQY